VKWIELSADHKTESVLSLC